MRPLYVVVLMVAAVLLASITSLLRNAQSCACEQTYMYTSYTEIPILDPRWAKHRYKLRLYRETGYIKQVLPPEGLPALLIPGNAGSYEQVRSLASETARLTAQARKAGGHSSSTVDMDWYALDLSGELSAFDGFLLSEQTAFALACLKQLRAMYSSSSSSHGPHHYADIARLAYNLRPQLLTDSSSSGNDGSTAAAAGAAAIVLVGHSMGGVIARAAATAAWDDPGLGPSSIALLLTLASPHQYPPLMLHPELARFYGGWCAGPLPAGLPAVSVHGGAADMQVATYLTRLPPATTSWTCSSSGSRAGGSNAVHMSLGSEYIPGVWLAAGHTQIDWCNQLVRRVAAALLEVHAQQQWRLQRGQQQQQQPEQQRQGRALLLQRMLQHHALVAVEGVPAGKDHGVPEQQRPQLLLPLADTGVLCAGSNTSCQQTLATAPNLHQQGSWRAASHSSITHNSSADQLNARVSHHKRSNRFQMHWPEPTVAASQHSLQAQWHQQHRQLVHTADMQRQPQQQGGVDVEVLLEASGVEPTPAAAHVPTALNAAAGIDADSQRQLVSMDHAIVPREGSVGQDILPGAAVTSSLLRQYLTQHSLGAAAAVAAAGGAGLTPESSLPPQLLLPDTTPIDVQLAFTGRCDGPQLQPEWFVNTQQAATAFLPAQERTLAVHPPADMSGGSVIFWDAPDAAHLVLLASGVKPCGSFRVWVLQQQQQQQHSWTDVSGHAVLLPLLQDELVGRVRDFNAWSEVVAGKDYLQHAAWAVTLSQQQLTATHVTRIAIWLAAEAPQQPGAQHTQAVEVNRSGEHVIIHKAPAAATLTAQWLPASKQQHRQTAAINSSHSQSTSSSSSSSSSSSPSVQGLQLDLGPGALLHPLRRPAGGAMLLLLQPRWQWLLGGLSVKVKLDSARAAAAADAGQQQQQAARPSSGISNRSCWHPVALYPSVWGGVQHAAMINTTCSSCSSSSSGSGGVGGTAVLLSAAHAREMLRTWLRAGIKASSQPGFASSTRRSVRLSSIHPGSSIQLLLDPSCSYSISLGWDAIDAAAQVLLVHANSAAGMAVALLLLVLSHQMSALIRLMTVARHGATQAHARPNSGTSRDKTLPAATAAAACSLVHQGREGFCDHLQIAPELSAPATPTAGTVRPDLRQLSSTALQRLRNRLDGTLGGAPPELQMSQLAPAGRTGANAAGAHGSKAAGAGPDSQAVILSSLNSAGISVLESLHAVISDVRVLLVAALLAAAASTLNCFNPDSLWFAYSGSSSGQGTATSRAVRSLTAAVGWLFHQGLGFIGLRQRGDSPSVAGAGLLLGVALLFLLLDVWLTVGVKWCLDLCSTTITAFNRSLTPNPETMAAIAATSTGGTDTHTAGSSSSSSSTSTATPCPCALCAAAGAACGVGWTVSGGFFGTAVGDSTSCLAQMAAATAGSSAPSAEHHGNATGAVAGLDGGRAAAAAAPAIAELSRGVAVALLEQQQHQQQWPPLQQARLQHRALLRSSIPWWRKGQCQVQLLCLLLLSLANIALGLAGGVLLLFFTWHLPSGSTAAAAKVAELLLGSRAGSRANSRPSSRATSPLPAGMAAAATVDSSSHSPRSSSITGSLRQSLPGGAQLAFAGGMHQQHNRTQQQLRTHSSTRPGSLASEGSNANAPPAAAAAAAAATTWGVVKAVQEQRTVRSDAGLLIDAEDDTEAVQPYNAAGVGAAHGASAAATLLQQRREDGRPPAAAAAGQEEVATASWGIQCRSSNLLLPTLPPPQQQQQEMHGSQHFWRQQQQQEQQQQQQLLPQGSFTGHMSRLGLPAGPPEAVAATAAASPLHGGSSGSSTAPVQAAVGVATRHDAAAARAVALHQLTCHMCHAWTLLYGCCCLMLLPSLLAWLQLPLGEQHLSHWLDVLLVLPVLLHCTAIAAGTVEALVGYGPATAAEARRIRHDNSSSSMRLLGTAGASATGSRHSGPVDLYKLVVRGASVYMFAAALMCQPVVWLGVVAAVASLMLGGQAAVEALHRLQMGRRVAGEHEGKAQKQKGT